MEPFIRVAFWTVTLFSFVCLQAKPIIISPQESNIKQMRKHVTCLPESTFYTPSNVLDKCIDKALQCIRQELQEPALDECDPKEDIRPAIDILYNHEINNPTPDNSTECDCHRWPQTNFSQFLNEMEALLQRHNARLSP